MRSTPPDSLSHIERQLALSKQRLKSSPSNKNKPAASPADPVLFAHNLYPFPNHPPPLPPLMKTTINYPIPPDKLRKLARLSHPHLVNILKISRGHAKPTAARLADPHYSFYFEVVPFSLKKVAVCQQCDKGLVRSVAGLDMRLILTQVSEYLMRQDIYHAIRLDDIGVTPQAQVKIYLSPLVACGEPSHINNRRTVMASVEKLVGWWETSLGSNDLLNPLRHHALPSALAPQEEHSLDHSQPISNKSSFIERENSQLICENFETEEMRVSNARDSMIKAAPLKNSINSYRSELSKISSMQLEKMRKIDQEIKFIRERLKEKAKHRKHKESDTIIVDRAKETNKSRHCPNIFESERLDKREDPQEDRFNRDSIQQNINCINIYNHPIKDTSTNLTPSQALHPTTTFYNPLPTPATIPLCRHPHFQPQDFPEDYSVDTYDMELDPQEDPTQRVPHASYRHTLVPAERQSSEHNCRLKESVRNHPKTSNQVANRNITESAGPLQFKTIVNKFIKPQFLSKKSNIYQDPGEYESERSKSISKLSKKLKMQNPCVDLFEAGKSATSKTQRTTSPNEKSKHEEKSKKQREQKQREQQKREEQQKSREAASATSILRINSDMRLPLGREGSTQKSQVAMGRKKMEESIIGERVKQVLQKTRNAIALLNRVKHSHSPSFHQSYHQTVSP